MSSSASRRPRVAGQRRRPVPGIEPATPHAVPEPGADIEPAPDRDLPPGRTRDHDTSHAVGPSKEGDDADSTADTAADTAAGTDATSTSATRRRLLVPALALALSLALLIALLLVTREDPAQRSRDASAASATARSTLEQILSYSSATMIQQIPVDQALLTGAFKDEFAATMTKTIVPLATKDKTVVKARAYEVGVMSQREDTVVVQAFVDQARTSDAQKEPSIDQNRVIATMTKVGDRWLVSALKAY